jgi:DNA-binding beta-propeller fold protein YncE
MGIFANLNGTISAWDTGTTAFIQVTTAGAVYTGLAINGAQTQLYAANGAGSGSIDVFDNTFTPVTLAAGAFVDPVLPAGLVPFNVQDISGFVYVGLCPRRTPRSGQRTVGGPGPLQYSMKRATS